jgi:hypothetical protein
MNEAFTALLVFTGLNLLAALVTVVIAWLIITRGKGSKSDLVRAIGASFAGVSAVAVVSALIGLDENMMPGTFGVLMGVIAAVFPSQKKAT